jgi:hypothetical protein
VVGLLFLVAAVFFVGRNRLSRADSERSVRVLLLGASVGKEWNFPQWPQRMNKSGYIFEMVPCYSFDKSQAIDDILIRPKRKFRMTRKFIKSLLKPAPRKPDIIIIKECAAYFPTKPAKYKALVNQWVAQCQEAGIEPVLTTVIPVTREHAEDKPGRQEGISEYNDWVRKYALKMSLPLLDLEAALRIDRADRFLRSDLAAEDGLHLNSRAYEFLDQWFLEHLDRILNQESRDSD